MFWKKIPKGDVVNHFERWDFTGKGKNDQDEAEVLAATTFQLYRRIRTGETGHAGVARLHSSEYRG